MDTLKQYIKMCNCPEIQGQWEIEIGDDFLDDEEHQIVWYEGMESKDQIKGRIEVYKADLQPKWLPRQDQIQEMLPVNNCKCSCCLIFHLNQFIEDNIEGFFDTGIETIEQYWLAFYMSENHQKIWDGEKWVKSVKE